MCRLPRWTPLGMFPRRTGDIKLRITERNPTESRDRGTPIDVFRPRMAQIILRKYGREKRWSSKRTKFAGKNFAKIFPLLLTEKHIDNTRLYLCVSVKRESMFPPSIFEIIFPLAIYCFDNKIYTTISSLVNSIGIMQCKTSTNPSEIFYLLGVRTSQTGE